MALLQILLWRETSKLYPTIETDPLSIPALLDENSAGLLIGDSALAFQENPPSDLEISDLGEWWNRLEGLPFVFALWAYHKELKLEDALFAESLEEGLSHLNQIVQATPFKDAETYLTKTLHYKMGPNELEALNRFEKYLQALDLL